MPAQPQFLSDLNIIGTKMLRNELRNFWVGDCIDSKFKKVYDMLNSESTNTLEEEDMKPQKEC